MNKKITLKKIVQALLPKPGLEPLTEDLIEELVQQKGMAEVDLRFIRKIGGRYLRSREAFILPRQINYRRPPTPPLKVTRLKTPPPHGN